MYRIVEKYSKVDIEDSHVLLLSENSGEILHTPIAVEILNQISEASVTREELLKKFTGTKRMQERLLTLFQLESQGYITEEPAYFPADESAYWQSYGYDLSKLANVFAETKVKIVSLSQLDTSELKVALEITGIRFSQNPDLTIVIADDYLHQELAFINQKATENNQAWLLVKLNGTSPIIGPLFNNSTDKSGACWKCLEHRLLLHDQENRFYQAMNKTKKILERPLTSHPLSRQVAISTLTLEIVDWMYHRKNDRLSNQLISLDVKYGKQTEHTVVRRPQCPSCGDTTIMQQAPKPIQLEQKASHNEVLGGYRTVKPEETLERFKHHISPISGIVPYLKEYHSMDGASIYNYASGKNLAMQSISMFWLNLHLRSANGGKGRTAIQAQAGALCEAIERYSLMYHGKTYTESGSWHQIKDAIHPNDCMLYSKSQYENRNQTNAASTKFYSLIPREFDPEEVMEWTPVYSLTEHKFKHLPSAYCFAQYPAVDEKNVFSYPDSNGCAAGNTLDEAILQGFLELVERDAAAIWWYNRISLPQVDLKSAYNPYVDEMISYYAQIDRSLYVLDLTTDMEIPVFAAVSHCKRTGRKDEILYAFGAHIDAKIALERSIIELNQMLPIVEKQKGCYLTKDQVFIDWLNNASIQKESYLIPSRELKNIARDYPQLCNPTIHDSIQFCIRVAQQNNLETLVLDLTQPDVGLPVAKVIVPGLRHFWRRTAPGRLYDVPVKMGWLQKKLSENELNPWSIFI